MRLRSPRYLAAVIIGALYLWVFLIRNARTGELPMNHILTSELILVSVSTVLLLSSARWWLLGSDLSALTFSAPEIQFLFPAPITRRNLVQAKLARMQIVILLNTLIFTVILSGDSSSLAAWQRGLALWILFTTLAFHRLGATIVRASILGHGTALRQRTLVPAVVFLVLVVALLYGLLDHWPALRAAHGSRAIAEALVNALSASAPSVALWPGRALIAPIVRAGAGSWWLTVLPAIGVLLLHYVWLLRLNIAFEEAALEATQRRRERRQHLLATQMSEARSRTGKLASVPRLALTGRPEVAIAWKNVAAALRGGRWRTQLIVLIIGLAVAAIASRQASERVGNLLVGVVVGWGGMMLFLGPLWMRFDLRLDLPRLGLLKTMPIAGWRIVAAEIAAVTMLHTITVWSLMVVPLLMILLDPALLIESDLGLPVLVSAAVGVPVFNLLMFTLQNGMAILFPAWIRLGTESRGFETMGQNLLTTGATTLAAAVALVFPAILGSLVGWLVHPWLQEWSILTGTLMGSLLVLAEVAPAIRWLGSMFEQIDVNEVAAAF